MLLGTTSQKVWEFANKQRFFLKEVDIIIDLVDLNKNNIDTLIKLDDRYKEIGGKFSGPIFFSHINLIIPISKKATESFEQLCRMFPEINRFLR
jgi:hypothetical protein